MLISSVTLTDVQKLTRQGIGEVYRGAVSIDNMHKALKKGVIRYAPKYQRGFKLGPGDLDEREYDHLFDLFDNRLNIDDKRSAEIAVKFLQGELYTTDVFWNARKDALFEEPTFNETKRELSLSGNLTIPDSGHRHKGYFHVVEWYYDHDKIPEQVVVNGVPVAKKEIVKLLTVINPKTEMVFVTIYSLTPEKEGMLYDEYNTEGKKPSTAMAIDKNPTKTPSRRFVAQLMEICSIFHRNEIEYSRNTIGSKSRKLTTNATLEAALKPKTKLLVELERKPEIYSDLVSFSCNFFKEWAYYFTAFQPGSSAEDRWQLREESFAISNIIFFPLFDIIFELWQAYNRNSIDWTSHEGWKSLIAKLASDQEIVDAEGNKTKLPIMSRKNADWRGKILTESTDKNGKTTWTLSSTRGTRKSAYQYLSTVAALQKTISDIQSV